MVGCRQKEVAAVAQEAGVVGGGSQDNGSSPSSPDNQLLPRPANWLSCSGEDGWRAGSEAETGKRAAGCIVAAERVGWTEPCP